MTTYLFQDQRRVLPSWLNWKKRLFFGAFEEGLPCMPAHTCYVWNQGMFGHCMLCCTLTFEV